MLDMHIHTRDILEGNNSINDFIEMEKQFGVDTIVFVEHGMRISEKHHGFLVDDDSYIKLKKIVEIAREKYPQFHIYSGIEIDYSYDNEFREKTLNYLSHHNFDFVIGSIHSIKFIDGLDYFNSIIDMINNYPISIIGHLKLRENWKDYKEVIKQIVLLCKEKNIAIEINTSSRSLWDDEQFDYMFSLIVKNNVKYTVGSDAHNVYQIGENYPLIKKRLRKGIKKI